VAVLVVVGSGVFVEVTVGAVVGVSVGGIGVSVGWGVPVAVGGMGVGVRDGGGEVSVG
jgi:hypothetical protein